MAVTDIESFQTVPLPTLIESYVYEQYQDDDNVQAFFDGTNALSQQYHDWFLQTPLTVYTDAAINGPLLDWVGQQYYGISRPVLGNTVVSLTAGMNSFPMNTEAMNGLAVTNSGTATLVSDDLYKRTLTWINYIGDGKQVSLPWLRRRVARFIYGANGTDLTDIGLVTNIKIQVSGSAVKFLIPFGTGIASSFINLLANGWLPVPFMQTFTAVESMAAQDNVSVTDTATLT